MRALVSVRSSSCTVTCFTFDELGAGPASESARCSLASTTMLLPIPINRMLLRSAQICPDALSLPRLLASLVKRAPQRLGSILQGREVEVRQLEACA